MNRLEQKNKELKRRKKKAFVAFITAGDPNLKTTEELVLAFDKIGVDIVELGVPFSDPLADGPTIQASSQRSLSKGTSLHQILDLIKKIRQRSQIPIALMTYYNPVFCFGDERFAQAAKASGVDAVVVPDLPPEEAHDLIRHCRKNDIATVFFVAPTTTKERMKRIAQASTGFIYYVSLTGVTGARKQMSSLQLNPVRQLKKITKTPVFVGFGVSSADQVKAVANVADGVIVGSAIVNQILRNKGNKNLVKNVSSFVRQLAKVL